MTETAEVAASPTRSVSAKPAGTGAERATEILIAIGKNLLAQFKETVLKPRPERALVLRETLSLGEKRFVALVECSGERFLVGGSSTSVNLISRLKEEAQ
jgi:flagellar biogenesis protein FliO